MRKFGGITIEEFHKSFFPTYKYFLSFSRLEDWAEKECIEVKYLKKVYPIKDFAKYYIHQYYRENKKLPKVRDLPKVVLQAYESNSYRLFRAAGFRDPKLEHYDAVGRTLQIFDIPAFKEADVLGVTVNHFMRYPKGVFIDIPFKKGITAHYFDPETMEYVFITDPSQDIMYTKKQYFQRLYEGIFNIRIKEIEFKD